MSLAPVKCTVCLENFPTLKVNAAGICTCCHDDRHSPKLYSAQNNMNPGPVPPKLKVSYPVLIKFLFVGRELEFLDAIPFTVFVFF